MKIGEDISQEEFDDIIRICHQEKPNCILGPSSSGSKVLWRDEDDLNGYALLLILSYPENKSKKKIKRYTNYFLYGVRTNTAYLIYLIKNGSLMAPMQLIARLGGIPEVNELNCY